MFKNTTNILIFAAVFLFDGAGSSADASDDWSYSGENGPDSWPGVCKTGVHQSPIHIVTNDTVKAGPSFLKFNGYNFAFATNVTNTGRTIELRNTEVPIHLKSSSLPYTYVLAQMHFHWDAEHLINGKRDALELHLVHYARQYDNATYAAQFKNGIAVVAVLFEISDRKNVHLDKILMAVKHVSSASSQLTTKLKTKVIPSQLLPKDRSSYYRYSGSFTSPGCEETVIWTVMSDKLKVSASQVKN